MYNVLFIVSTDVRDFQQQVNGHMKRVYEGGRTFKDIKYIPVFGISYVNYTALIIYTGDPL
jgi:hypothetical protein